MNNIIKFAFIYLMLACVATAILGGHWLFIAVYLVMSIATYITYAVDKNAAEKGKWRIPEKTLHILALLFGWPGALCAQQRLRHKSQKQPFKSILWITVIINTVIFGWTFTEQGQSIIQPITDLF